MIPFSGGVFSDDSLGLFRYKTIPYGKSHLPPPLQYFVLLLLNALNNILNNNSK